MSVFNKEKCISLLREKYASLHGERFPKKDDFSADEVVAIKAFLGPWPRALEKAGIKEEDPARLAKKQEKRIHAKKSATQRKINKKMQGQP